MVSLSIYIFLTCISNFVLGYHFYNPSNQIIFKSSSRILPTGYIRLRPARHSRYTRHPSTKRRPNGFCTEPGFVCNEPYNSTYTAIFECKNDNQCPLYYKCCEQKCFQHKICVESTYRKPEITDDVCEKWPYNCAYPYPYIFSKRFMCLRDSQCPKNYKCCSQNCFLHKICSKVVSTTIQTISENKENQVRNEPDDETTSHPSTSGDPEVEKTERTNYMEDVEIITEKASEQEEVTFENTEEEVGEESERKLEEDEKEANSVVQINKDETEINEIITSTETATEYSETTTAAVTEVTEVVTTEKTEETPEHFDVTDKVTVVVLVTPDPNAIESILPQNIPIASENDDSEPSTRNPEYEEYYEEYDVDGDDEENYDEIKN